jgi:hypothetical protein
VRVLGEYSAEIVRTVVACMAACLGVGRFPRVWSYLGAEDGGD